VSEPHPETALGEGVEEEPAEALDARLGEAAVRLKMLTAEQVERTLAARPAGDSGRMPGQVFVDAGLLSSRQLDYLETVRRFKAKREADKRLGDRVVAHGWASTDQVNHVLQLQKQAFLKERREYRLGELLVAQGVLNAAQRDQLLDEQREARAEAGAAEAAAPPEETGEAAAPAGAAGETGPAEPAEATVAGEEEAAAGLEPLRFDVADDHLTAFINLEEGHGPPDADEVKALLQKNGVVHGIDEAAIERLCSGEVDAGVPLTVAQGQAPRPGRDGEIEFFFDTAPLKAGRETEDGHIDFKDRGQIPQVYEGDTLAYKTEPSEGEGGMDVFGRVVPPPPPRDPPLRPGKGVEMQADGATIVATTGGHPRVSATGVLSVYPEYTIEDDVAYNTGHVDFEGRVVVMGSVRKGFRVRCGELVAQEAEEAEIEAEGDVQITGGVLGAHIKAGGTVRARYLHDAVLAVMGDVIVDKEVIDSRVETSGAFHGESCTVLTSTIAAKEGIYARDIGSETSKACRLIAGVDERLEAELAALDEQVAEKEKTVEALSQRTGTLTERRQELDNELAELAQVQDRGQVRQRELHAALEAGEADPDQAEAERRRLEREVKEAEEQVNARFTEQDQLMDELDTLREQEPAEREALEALQEQARELRTWAEQNPGLPRIDIARTLHSGTRIKTPRHEVKLSRDYPRVTLEERVRTDERGRKVWRLGRVR